MDSFNSAFYIALRFHKALPNRLRDYLNGRGIAGDVIDHQLIGWNGWRLTLPIMGRDGRNVSFRLAKDPDDETNSPKMLSTPGAKVDLYGWESLMASPSSVVICEGEFDRLVLESSGFNAVTSTGGAATFRPEWADAFPPDMDVYICFDRDEPGEMGARKVASMIPHARIIRLPEEVGDGGDVSDYFARLGHTREDFLELVRTSEQLPEYELLKPEQVKHDALRTNGRSELERLKALVPIESVIGRYLKLRKSGKHFVALCPFHTEHEPSFVVYPSGHNYHCFGCDAHGDAIDFLIRHVAMSFPEALALLRTIADPHYGEQAA